MPNFGLNWIGCPNWHLTDEIDFDDLLKEPVNQELLKLSDDAIRFKRKSSFRDKKQLPQLSSVQEKPLTRKRFNSL